jgi:hypothetical protein
LIQLANKKQMEKNMKKLLIGLLALVSFSAFANEYKCEASLFGSPVRDGELVNETVILSVKRFADETNILGYKFRAVLLEGNILELAIDTPAGLITSSVKDPENSPANLVAHLLGVNVSLKCELVK